MLIKIEHRAVIELLTKQEKSQKTIYKEMVSVYQYSAHSLSSIKKWFIEFKRVGEGFEDDDRSGRPATHIMEENVEKIRKLYSRLPK